MAEQDQLASTDLYQSQEFTLDELEQQGRRHEHRRRVLCRSIFPVLVLALFALLVACNLNGASFGVLQTDEQLSKSLIIGTPRAIRSDDFLVRFPLAISQDRKGYEQKRWVGLTETDIRSLPGGGPTTSYIELLKPTDWGYFALGTERGFAFQWWLPFAFSLIALYALALILGARTSLAICTAFVATFSPYTAWWSGAQPASCIGAAAAIAALVLVATQARHRNRAVLATLGAAFFIGVEAMQLYPPWIIPMALVVGALLIGQVLDRRLSWIRFAVVTSVSATLAVAALAPWFTISHSAISAMANTIYPGHRIAEAGTMHIAELFSAPLNVFNSTNIVTYTRSNQSESSSVWLPLVALFVILGGVIYSASKTRSSRLGIDKTRTDNIDTDNQNLAIVPQPTSTSEATTGTWSAICLALVLVLLIAWATLPLPKFVGSMTGLNKGIAGRAAIGVGLCAALLLGVASIALRRSPVARVFGVLALIAISADVAITLWAASGIHAITAVFPRRSILPNAAAISLGFLWVAFGPRRALACVALSTYCFFSWSLVNPLSTGIEPFASAPSRFTDALNISTLQAKRIAIFGGGILGAQLLGAQLLSTDAEMISNATFYPDPKLMRRLAPGQEKLWNNFVHYGWVEDLSVKNLRLEPIGEHAKALRVNPCGDEVVSSLKIDIFLSPIPLEAPCLVLLRELRDESVAKAGIDHLFVYSYI